MVNKQALLIGVLGAICSLDAAADYIQLTTPGGMAGAVTTLDFEGGQINNPDVTFEAGSTLVNATPKSSGVTTSGVFGLHEAAPYNGGPENLATFTSGVYQVGMFFGNDDTCCTSGFDATLSVYNLANQLIGSVSVTANMDDFVNQFIGIQTDELIFRSVLDYGQASNDLWGYIDDFTYGGDALAVPPDQVPVPATLALLMAGGLGMAWRRRRHA